MFNLSEEVIKLVQDWTAQSKSFTAFDVTMELRNANPNEQIYHVDVKALVHAMFLGSKLLPTYTRTTVTLGSGQQPFMYHPINNPPASAAAPVVVGAPSLGQQLGQTVKGVLNGLRFWNK